MIVLHYTKNKKILFYGCSKFVYKGFNFPNDDNIESNPFMFFRFLIHAPIQAIMFY